MTIKILLLSETSYLLKYDTFTVVMPLALVLGLRASRQSTCAPDTIHSIIITLNAKFRITVYIYAMNLMAICMCIFILNHTVDGI